MALLEDILDYAYFGSRRAFLSSNDDAYILHRLNSRILLIRDEDTKSHEQPRQTQMPLLEDVTKPAKREAAMA